MEAHKQQDGNTTARNKGQGAPVSTYSKEAEEYLTSAAVAGYRGAQAQVLTLLPDDFCGDVSHPLAEAIHDLTQKGTYIDYVSIIDWLDHHHKLSDALGQSTIFGMVRDFEQSSTCDADSFQEWANIIRDYAIGRAESSYHALMAEAAIRRVEPSEKDTAPYKQALERLRAGRQSSLLSIDELLREVPVPYIVDGILPAQALAMCHADESQLKSFVVLDLLCHIATGKAWHGHKIKTPGKVVIVVGEGGSGIAKRLRAWSQYHGVSLQGKLFVRKPRAGVPPFALLEKGHVEGLLADMKAIDDVVAIVFDTLSSILPGVDMNGGIAGEMLQAESLARRIVAEAGVTCLFVHHNNGAGQGPRGATSFRNAMDMRFSTKAEKDAHGIPTSVTVHCEKPRDDEPFRDLKFTVHVKPVPTDDDPHSTSLVMDANYSAPEQSESKEERQYRQLLILLFNQGASASSTKWENDARLHHNINHKDYVNAVRDMRNLGYITKGPGKQDPYQITEKGLEYIGQQPTPPDNPGKQYKQYETVQNRSYHPDSSGGKNSTIVRL
jgi:hypothetical protein